MKQGSDFALEMDTREGRESAVFQSRLRMTEAAALLEMADFDPQLCAVIAQAAFRRGFMTMLQSFERDSETFRSLVAALKAETFLAGGELVGPREH